MAFETIERGGQNWTFDGVSVDIASYTQSNPYTVPKDGYLVIGAPTGQIAEANTIDTATPMTVVGTSSSFVYSTFFLKKGMKIYPSTKPTSSLFIFRGLTTY